MISTLTDMAAVVVPACAAVVAAAAAFGVAARRHISAQPVVARPRTADLGVFWAAPAIDGTTGAMTQRKATSYDPQSRGSTG